MSSLAQIDANRANAQFSTGPKTAKAKPKFLSTLSKLD
jgi:hypothetical protein